MLLSNLGCYMRLNNTWTHSFKLSKLWPYKNPHVLYRMPTCSQLFDAPFNLNYKVICCMVLYSHIPLSPLLLFLSLSLSPTLSLSLSLPYCSLSLSNSFLSLSLSLFPLSHYLQNQSKIKIIMKSDVWIYNNFIKTFLTTWACFFFLIFLLILILILISNSK